MATFIVESHILKEIAIVDSIVVNTAHIIVNFLIASSVVVQKLPRTLPL